MERVGRPIEHEDLVSSTALPYLDAVMKEAFRSLASVPQLSREVRTSDSTFFVPNAQFHEGSRYYIHPTRLPDRRQWQDRHGSKS